MKTPTIILTDGNRKLIVRRKFSDILSTLRMALYLAHKKQMKFNIRW